MVLIRELAEKLIRVIDAVIDVISPRLPKLVPVPVRRPRRTAR